MPQIRFFSSIVSRLSSLGNFHPTLLQKRQQFRPYAGNRWWVLLITLGFAVAAVGAAHLLAARRDLHAGLLPDPI